MGSPKSPTPPSPAESASAAVAAAQAGDIYQAVNAPLTGYADLYTQAALGPARAQLQQGLANRLALQSAQGQEAIQSQVDPMAYALRQMNLKAASSRLSSLYGYDPSAFSVSYPGAFATPSPSGLPSVSGLAQGTQEIARNLKTVKLSPSGNISY